MKKTILYSALSLAFFSVSYVSAQDSPCTTEDNGSGCGGCSISVLDGHERLYCSYLGVATSKRIDDCFENRLGLLQAGVGAGDSCKDYQLDNNIFSARCRNGDGNYVYTSRDIRRYFVGRGSDWLQLRIGGGPAVGTGIFCAQ